MSTSSTPVNPRFQDDFEDFDARARADLNFKIGGYTRLMDANYAKTEEIKAIDARLLSIESSMKTISSDLRSFMTIMGKKTDQSDGSPDQTA